MKAEFNPGILLTSKLKTTPQAKIECSKLLMIQQKDIARNFEDSLLFFNIETR